jgi:hypothetical protein
VARERNSHAEYIARLRAQGAVSAAEKREFIRKQQAGEIPERRRVPLTYYEATHRQGGTVPAFLQGRDQVVTVKVSYRESKRVGRYDSLVAQLLKGRISEKKFDRKVSHWAPLRVDRGGEVPEGRYRFADSATALYLAESTRDLSDREYERRLHFDIQGS